MVPGRSTLRPSYRHVLADLPLSSVVSDMLAEEGETLPWQAAQEPKAERIAAIDMDGHPIVDAALRDRLPALRGISNIGFGVYPINLTAAERGSIPFGNTPASSTARRRTWPSLCS